MKKNKTVKAWALVDGESIAFGDYDFLEIAKKRTTLIRDREEHAYLSGTETIPVTITYSLPDTKK